MKLAGKYMMEELAPHSLSIEADPSVEIARAKPDFSLVMQSPSRFLMEAYPGYAFNAQGLGFSPADS